MIKMICYLFEIQIILVFCIWSGHSDWSPAGVPHPQGKGENTAIVGRWEVSLAYLGDVSGMCKQPRPSQE
jgi:hypothetical protein